jgi:hypothetical protein
VRGFLGSTLGNRIPRDLLAMERLAYIVAETEGEHFCFVDIFSRRE